MSDTPKTTCYHSELARRGTVNVIVETDVIPSKFAGKPPYVVIKLDGFSRRYDTENDACAQSFVGLKGCEVTLTATGSRETAAIVINGSAMAPQQSTQPQAHRAAPQSPRQAPAQHDPVPSHPPVGNENPIGKCKRELNKVANGYLFLPRRRGIRAVGMGQITPRKAHD